MKALFETAYKVADSKDLHFSGKSEFPHFLPHFPLHESSLVDIVLLTSFPTGTKIVFDLLRAKNCPIKQGSDGVIKNGEVSAP